MRAREGKPPSSARVWWNAPVWLCALLCVATAHAQPLSPEVSRGLAWLQSQVQADGSLANEAFSVATGLQSRSEAAQTFKLLSAIPVGLTDAIAAEVDDNTEYLARRIVSLGLAGRDPSTLLAALAARQNSDGGFGGGLGYDSNALDTAWALIAFRSSTSLGAVPQALGFLGLAQAFDGSYSAPGRPDIETTAVAVLALGLYASQFDSFAAISRAVPYLLSQQSPSQQWGNSAFLTATVYAAIHDVVPLEPTATAVRAFLVGRQGADGSWDGDPFSTALALRALVLTATAPANPTLGIVRGRVVDSQTRLGLDGVSVTLSGPSNPVPAVTSARSFEFRDLLPGAYTLQLSLNQYGVITFSTTLKPGQTVDFGAIALTKNANATTGTIRGAVVDAATGLPLAGATVSLSSGLSAKTDAGGNYQISNVPPGNLIVVANKTGYASASGSGNLLAGATLIFSAGLIPITQSAATAIEGTVTDAVTHAPLAGAAITVTGSTQAGTTTDAQGHYRIAPLNTGAITVTVALTGYRSVTATATVAQNSTIQFSPALSAAGAVKFFVVSGPVIDSPNGMYRYEMAGPADVPALDLTLTDPSLNRPCCLAFSDSGEMLVVNRGPQTSSISGSISRFSNPQGTPAFTGTITSNSFSAPH